MADDVSGVDFSKYATWGKVTTPSGGVYYQVPNSAWVYDPVSTQLRGKGRPVLFRNPKPGLDEKQKAQDQHDAQVKLQENAMSPQGQLLPLFGGTATALGGAYLANQMWGNPAKAVAQNVAQDGAKQVLQQGVSPTNVASVANPGVQQVANQAVAPVANTASEAFNGATAIGQNADGSLIMSNAVAPEASNAVSAAVPSAAPGFIESITPNLSGFGGSAAGFAVPAAVAGATYLGGKAALDMAQGHTPGLPGRIILGMATGGLSEVAGHFLGQHKKTSEVQNDRWSDLAKDGVITPEQLAAKQADLQRSAKERSQDPITGKSWDLQTAVDRVKQGGAAADEFAQTYGPHKVYGADWGTYTPDQQRAIIKANADAGNWTSSKGDVLFKDDEKAKQIKDQVLSGNLGTVNPSGSAAPIIVPPARSTTSSPGMALDGGRISYMGKELAKRANARTSR